MKEETAIYFLWIHWEKRIISFEEAEGFERLEYPTHKEMLDFAIQKGLAGFGIQ